MRKLKLFVGILLSNLFFMACNTATQTPATEETAVEEEIVEETPTTETTEETVVLEINSNDQMKFDKTELTAPAGATVKLTLNHTGTMDKSVMGHNVVILKQGVDVADFAVAAVAAKDNAFIPANRENDVIAHTEVIGGGESTSVTFAAPAAGTYDFICSFPGHYGIMKGKFIVQ